MSANCADNAHSDTEPNPGDVETYSSAIESDPENVTLYNDRGLAYAALEEYDKAIADYDKAIELNPGYADAYYNRGLAYYYLSLTLYKW